MQVMPVGYKLMIKAGKERESKVKRCSIFEGYMQL